MAERSPDDAASPSENMLKALGRMPSGLFVVTAGTGDAATGFLASWIQQAGFEPPTVTVAVKKGRPIVDLLHETKAFCVNILGTGDKDLLRHFAAGFAPGVPAFTGIDTGTTSVGIPYLRGALAYLDCRVLGSADWSDHLLFCGEVVAGARHRDEVPMTHVRKTGGSY